MKALAPNTLIQNRYLIVQLIGKGGMGDVYLAVDQRLGSAVALKRTFFADDEMLGGAFEREAKILARLRHPVLPKVSDHFSENEEQFLVMEHISGDDLFKRLEMAKKPFPLSWVLFWADQLLDALSYLHTNEPAIIHRDIKPQNLKLTDENHIVLLDFGLSKNSAGETQFTNSGSVVGYTPHYAPMEQIRGMGTSPRSDIYALSATLYQLMSNNVPADALSRADALLNGMEDPIKAVSEVNPEIQPVVSDVILKGMEISQEKRFQSAREMQKALRDAFGQMQSAMAAPTAVFTAPEIPTGERVAVVGEAVASGAGGIAGVASGGSEADEFEATLRYDPAEGPAPENFDDTIKQADVKTDVFLGSDPAMAFPVDVHAENGSSQEDIPVSEIFSKIVVDAGPGESAGPASSELANTEDIGHSVAAPSAPVFFTEPGIVGEQPDSFVTRAGGAPPSGPGQTEDFSQERAATPSPAAARPAPPKKSSKAPLILGGVAALFILAAIAVGGGWIIYQRYYAGGVVSTTTPTPLPSLSPTPMSTPETVYGSNSSSNSDVDIVSDVNSNSDIGNTSISTVSTPSPGEPAATPRTVKTPVRPPVGAKTPAPVKQNDRLKTEQ
jgi:serine/threonine protein kinase